MDDDGSTDDSGGTVAPSLSGVVSRLDSAIIAAGRDGVGTVYIAALAECSLDAESVGGGAVQADLSTAGSEVEFALNDLTVQDGETVHLAVFLDDDGNADPMAPAPGPGDILFADVVGDGVLSCVEASAGDDDVLLPLTATVPLPSIGGTVARDAGAAIAEGNDGVGTVFIAALDACALDAELVGSAVVPSADLSDPGTALPWAIDDIATSTVHLAFFLDDNGDADAQMPLPGPGDIVFADGVGDGILSCVEVGAGDDAVELALNAAVPWP